MTIMTSTPLEESLRELTAYVKANSADAEFLQQCHDRATALVSDYLCENTVPAKVVAGAVLEVAAELFNRRKLRNGTPDYAGGDGTSLSPVRVTRDPMRLAYPLLDPFLPGGFA